MGGDELRLISVNLAFTSENSHTIGNMQKDSFQSDESSQRITKVKKDNLAER